MPSPSKVLVSNLKVLTSLVAFALEINAKPHFLIFLIFLSIFLISFLFIVILAQLTIPLLPTGQPPGEGGQVQVLSLGVWQVGAESWADGRADLNPCPVHSVPLHMPHPLSHLGHRFSGFLSIYF